MGPTLRTFVNAASNLLNELGKIMRRARRILLHGRVAFGEGHIGATGILPVAATPGSYSFAHRRLSRRRPRGSAALPLEALPMAEPLAPRPSHEWQSNCFAIGLVRRSLAVRAPVRAPKAEHWQSAWPSASKDGPATGAVGERRAITTDLSLVGGTAMACERRALPQRAFRTRWANGGATVAIPAQRQRARCALSQ